MEEIKNIALVAHDNRKKDLMEWIQFNCQTLLQHHLICTGTTGRLVEETIRRHAAGIGLSAEKTRITKLKSGPLGGDQQLGSLITEGRIDILIFFTAPPGRRRPIE